MGESNCAGNVRRCSGTRGRHDELAESGTWVVDAPRQPENPRLSELVAHDLRSPVAAVLMGLAALEEALEREDGDAPALLELVRRHAQRALGAADDIADLVALQCDALRPSLCAIDLRALVCRVVHEAAGPGPVTVTARLPAAPLIARVDARRVLGVVSALVAEARARARSRVTVGLRAQGSSIEIEIDDDGVAGSPERLSGYLDARYRPDAHRPGGGLGVRLATARDIVAAHGGAIHVCRGAHRGALHVIVSLPAGV